MEKIVESLRKNKIGIILIITSAIVTAFGQYFWKISEGSKLIELIIGFGLYGVGAILMIIAFKFGSLSVLHPMMSMGYVIALFIGYFLLGESITIFKVMAIIFILVGVILMGVGDE